MQRRGTKEGRVLGSQGESLIKGQANNVIGKKVNDHLENKKDPKRARGANQIE